MAKSDGLGPNQIMWIEALESHKFKQTFEGALKNVEDEYCCLGVACELFKTEHTVIKEDFGNYVFDGYADYAAPFAVEALSLRLSNGGARDGTDALYLLNDNGKTFPEIAAIIRANPSNYFKSAK